jgi:hypothetical protein
VTQDPWSSPAGETGPPAPATPAYGPPPTPYGSTYGPPPTPYGMAGHGQVAPMTPYPPYAAALGGAAPPLKDLRGLGTGVIALSLAYTALLVVTAALAPGAHEHYAADPAATQSSLTLVSALSTPVSLALWVVTSIWRQRAWTNAAAVAGPGRMRRSVAWCWLAWIVPVVFYWFPKTIVDDVVRLAATPSGEGPQALVGHRPRVVRTTAWWTLWVATMGLSAVTSVQAGFAGFQRALFQATAAQQNAADYNPVHPINPVDVPLSVIVALLAVAAVVLWIRVVRQVGAVHAGLLAEPSG